MKTKEMTGLWRLALMAEWIRREMTINVDAGRSSTEKSVAGDDGEVV